MTAYTSIIKNRFRWLLVAMEDTRRLLFSPSTNCDSSVTMDLGEHKMNSMDQTMRGSLICCSLKETHVLIVGSASFASTQRRAGIEVCLSGHAAILFVTAAGHGVWRKGKERVVCFVQRAMPHQTLLPISVPQDFPMRPTKLRSLIHPNCWLCSTT